MKTMAQRAEERRKKITVTKIALHSKEHHSFHLDLDLKSAWELLTRISKEAWIEEHGTPPSSRVDKRICKFIPLDQY